MSDAVKVIIEIPEEVYGMVMNTGTFGNYRFNATKAIKNGTPLDSAEIEKKCDRINSIASVLSYPQHREIQELLCEILESIGKESEE